MLLRYLCPVVCKSLAVLSDGSAAQSKKGGSAMEPHVLKLLMHNLRSEFVSCQVAALHSVLYLLEARITSVIKAAMAPLIGTIKALVAATDEPLQPQLVMPAYAAAFLLVEQYSEETDVARFIPELIDSIVMTFRVNADVSIPVYSSIVKGLDRLTLSFSLAQADRARITDLARKLAAASSSIRSRAGAIRTTACIGLLVTCMYTGRDGDRAGEASLIGKVSDEITPVSAAAIDQVPSPVQHPNFVVSRYHA